MESITLKISGSRYKNAFERSKDAILFSNKEGKFLDFNKAAASLLGYSKAELLNLNFTEILYDISDRDQLQKLLSSKKEVKDFITDINTKQGDKVSVCLNITNESGEAKEEDIFLWIVRDVSSHKKEETELRNAEKLAVTSRVARTIAHEVRNPLTNVNLSVEQLKNEITGKDETLDMYFDIITRNCERINNLITELLNATKPAPLVASQHSLNEIAEQAVSLLNEKITSKEIKIEREYHKSALDVNVDAVKIKEAIYNVLLNAIEAVEPKTGIIKIKTSVKHDKYTVIISDNGTGLSKESLDKVFEPFYSTRHNAKGLGLTSAQNILLTHKGNINVESEEGKGTTVTLSFTK